jgi:hypothetical protein
VAGVADEDRLHTLAESWRTLATNLRTSADDGANVTSGVTANNEGAAVASYEAYWRDLRSDMLKAANAAEQTAVGVDLMAKGTLNAKKAIAGALQSTHNQIQEARALPAVAGFIGPIIGQLLRLLLGFIVRILGALLKWIWKGIVWLFRKIGQFFKWLWNKLFGKKKPPAPKKPTYTRNGKLPHARDLLRNGKEFTGRKLPNQAQRTASCTSATRRPGRSRTTPSMMTPATRSSVSISPDARTAAFRHPMSWSTRCTGTRTPDRCSCGRTEWCGRLDLRRFRERGDARHRVVE